MRQRMSLAARTRIRETFTWDYSLRLLRNVYESLRPSDNHANVNRDPESVNPSEGLS
jgi:hypothetical protein